ncbi:MAG: FHA domain-containing protein [Pseudomonadota bacterium]|nr:MAG: FHA domain-containing protein [Pseudomonadota bacterium]
MQFRLKAASGPHTGQTFPLEQDTSIGSADDADIRLDDLMGRHLRIVYDGDTLMLEPAGKVWVNGEPVQRRPLKSGDEIRVGEHRFVLQAPGLRPPSVLRDAGPHRQRRGVWISLALIIAGALAAAAYFYWL